MDWDARYAATEGYLFGVEPAGFIMRESGVIAPASRVLCVADGEGRNSVYLAGQGHRVTAFDISSAALARARDLAATQNVILDLHLSGVEDWDWSRTFDAVIGIFIQFAGPDMRAQLFARMAGAVAPGGLVLLHGYAPRQVAYGTGGPPVAENMYTEDMLRSAFAGWQVLHVADYDAEIEEGSGHSGRSALVDFIARKPELRAAA